jgi:phage-related protein
VDAGKELIWVGSSKEDLSAFPDDVKLVMGFALRVAQQGGKHLSAKPLKGYKGAGVLEIVDDFDGDTYRAVYALDAFQKKSKKGIATSKADLDRIQARLKRAEQMHGERLKEREGNGKAKG